MITSGFYWCSVNNKCDSMWILLKVNMCTHFCAIDLDEYLNDTTSNGLIVKQKQSERYLKCFMNPLKNCC